VLMMATNAAMSYKLYVTGTAVGVHIGLERCCKSHCLILVAPACTAGSIELTQHAVLLLPVLMIFDCIK